MLQGQSKIICVPAVQNYRALTDLILNPLWRCLHAVLLVTPVTVFLHMICKS
jgi:hypothetical protein